MTRAIGCFSNYTVVAGRLLWPVSDRKFPIR